MKYSIYTLNKYGKYQYFHYYTDMIEFLKHYLLTFQKKYVIRFIRDTSGRSTRRFVLTIEYYIVTDKTKALQTEQIIVRKRGAYVTTNRPFFGELPYYD